MSRYFTKEQIQEVASVFKDLSGVGINVDSYSTTEKQRGAFFDKAKLWRVIEQTISILYIDRLVEGKMFLHDREGNEFSVVKRGGGR